MIASKNVQAPVCSVTVQSAQIEQVNCLKYLGSWITSDGRSDRDIRCRIGQAKEAHMDMRNVLCARSIALGVRKRLLKSSTTQHDFCRWQQRFLSSATIHVVPHTAKYLSEVCLSSGSETHS